MNREQELALIEWGLRSLKEENELWADWINDEETDLVAHAIRLGIILHFEPDNEFAPWVQEALETLKDSKSR